jgi:glutathione S-transferase
MTTKKELFMAWVHLVMLLATVQLFVFGFLVGRARTKFGVKAPATTGNENFERVFRAHQNTLEMMVLFLPSIWLASIYWSPWLVALIGLIYIVGRFIYFFGYARSAEGRHLGFFLSGIPILILMVLSLTGIIRLLLG